MKCMVVIPARYGSSRFPGKPLAPICGKPMIQWVCERASLAKRTDGTLVATDDQRILDAVTAFGGQAVMTGECACGTDRVYQAVRDIPCDVVINVQGDLPTVEPEQVDALADAFADDTVYMATLKKRIGTEAELTSPNVVKVVTAADGSALYFSRSPIPYDRDRTGRIPCWKHIGIYAYRRDFLETFVRLPVSPLEDAEKLEQLRALENGYRIRVLETAYDGVGVDTAQDVAAVEAYLRAQAERAKP